MAINPNYRNYRSGWQDAGPSLDPHHQHNGPFKDHSAKPATNGAFGVHAPLLLKNGYSPVPIEPTEKRPLGAIGDWNRLRTTPLTAEETADIATQHPNAGLGVVGGFGGLVPIDIDTDNVDIRMAIDTVFGGPLVAKRGQRGATVFFRDPSGLIKPRKFRMVDGRMILEVLATGQTVVPPTIHPETQQPYRWLTDYTLFELPIDELPVLPPDTLERLQGELLPWLPPPREYQPKSNGGAAPASPKRMRAYAEAALEGERQILAGMLPKSGRNRRLFDAACKLGRYVHHGVLSIDELESAILDEACNANDLIKDDGLRACKATLASGLRKAEGDDLPVLEDRGASGSDAQAEQAASQRHRGNGHDAGAGFTASSGDDAPAGDAKKEGGREQKPDPDLVEMNEKYAVVKVGGKTRVVFLEENLTYPGCKVPVYSSINDFCAFQAKRRKVVKDEKGEERKTGIGRWWINHEQRRQYDGIVYAPGADAKVTQGKLNLWTGFSCAPVKGNCALYLAHLKENVCSGVEAHFQYLLNWMAYAVQHPDKPGEVAVVMRGKEGVGKGVAAKEFGRLLGSHYRHISQAGHLTGHFNAHLQQCSVLFADEAFFAGDRSHESILKALITEDTLMIEPKGIDAFAVRNCLHLIMSSNNDWVIPAGADARRYFVLGVSDAKKQDHGYFATIAREMDAGGCEALLHHLLHRDLSSFNVRDVPQTDALADQKAHSRRGVDRVVEVIAHSGILPAAHAQHANVAVTSGEEDGNGFYPKARMLAPDLKYASSTVIRRALKDWGCEPWKSGYERGIKFPPLKQLRDAFDKKHGPQDWQKPTGTDVPAQEQDWGAA